MGTAKTVQIWSLIVLVLGIVTTFKASADDNLPSGEIVFESLRDGNYEIYVMNADGSDERNLTNHAAYDILPIWSPDGSQIAFMSDREGEFKIFVMNADGSNTHRLTNLEHAESPIGWSPDGRVFLFLQGEGPRQDGNIYRIHLDSRVVDIVYKGEAGGGIRDVSWSSSSDWIVFVQTAGFEIITVNTHSSQVINLSQTAGIAGSSQQSPTWSPDGDEIAFHSAHNNISAVYLMDENGHNLRQLTKADLDARHIRWSSNEKQIIFSALSPKDAFFYDQHWILYSVDCDGNNFRQLTGEDRHSIFPDLSPDGRWIVFDSQPDVACRDCGGNIYLLNLIDGTTHQLTETVALDFRPAWRPQPLSENN